MNSKGSRTSELEATKPVFGLNDAEAITNAREAVNNSGNPVFSCLTNINATDVAATPVLTASEDVFQGYNTKKQHPMYMTSSMDYGSRQPTVHTMPTMFHAKNQKFSAHLSKCGMYRDHSLNTAMDKSTV
ncbi:UPF0691 protein C9orf116 homolog isoform X1 [Xenia sp. Carnegie-2017]|uniref:UPF0691 protein C9orf116 homolog isoform X1 n=1 Tax=Xenia sp. Carnegie-2017 TaxID=2897299 RepID=UPI001F037E3B|nr:UPF0691 protein C9orf116 homolog isoform X1 [Xenia sp. Carnegie-2017]